MKQLSTLVLTATLACSPSVKLTSGDASATPSSDASKPDTADNGEVNLDGGTPVTTDTQTETETDTGPGTDTANICEQAPPANEPDGCRRRLVTQTPAATAFTAGSQHATISRNGQLVAFVAFAQISATQTEDLPGDSNTFEDVYAFDTETEQLEIVSQSGENEIGNGASVWPSINADGRFVAFASQATNLVSSAQLETQQIYVRDRLLSEVRHVSQSSTGQVADGYSNAPLISADGRFVVFESLAANLVPGDQNGKADLFIRDLQDNETHRLSVTNTGAETADNVPQGAAGGISDDGRFVLFSHIAPLCPEDTDSQSMSANKRIDVFLRDRLTKRNTLISRPPDGVSESIAKAVALSGDGSQILFYTGDLSHYTGDDVGGLLITTPTVATFEKAVTVPGIIEQGFGMSDDGGTVVFSSTDPIFAAHLGPSPIRDAVNSGFVFDRLSEAVSVVTASEDGTPGFIPDYYETSPDQILPSDWVDLAISGDGQKVVFSTIQVGILGGYGIPCSTTPRQIYLRDCPEN